MIEKYSHYQYKIDEIDVEIACHPRAEQPEYKTGYVFEILDVYMNGGSEESSEWYDTEGEAHEAARDRIAELESGPSGEPDYDKQNYFEQGPGYWEERRKLGE